MSHPINELTGYRDFGITQEAQRLRAVAAALKIIEAKVANTPTNSTVVSDEMDRLDKYADLIQEALKVK